ncbi:hypothetical protein IQ06DRAFT_290303 [Phaeosphaeriaceae sp. SRC1lsM3a]|nr:hypothetical protein IQ06DRAFT_290303 [Stagonospora sp. SRC1lsM3a]
MDKPALTSKDPVAAKVEDMTIESSGRAIMPASGIGTYRNRLEDHYGLKPYRNSRWPKRGIRIPYEPFTHDDLKVDTDKETHDSDIEVPDGQDGGANEPDLTDLDKKEKNIAPDANKRSAFSFRSMDVPVFHQACQDWGKVDESPPPGQPGSEDGGDDEESEDEGDKFRKSYMEAIRPSGPTAPSGVGEGENASAGTANNPTFLQAGRECRLAGNG